jgi:hypothetical protein
VIEKAVADSMQLQRFGEFSIAAIAGKVGRSGWWG